MADEIAPPRPIAADLVEGIRAMHAYLRAKGWDEGGALGTVKRDAAGAVIATREDYAFARDRREASDRTGVGRLLATYPPYVRAEDDEVD